MMEDADRLEQFGESGVRIGKSNPVFLGFYLVYGYDNLFVSHMK